MNKFKVIFTIVISLLSCDNEIKITKMKFSVDEIPNYKPIEFKQQLVPENMLIHKGVFSPDLQEFYYTISNKSFDEFDVYMIKMNNGMWSKPQKAFFNSKFNDHGMNFSPDGNILYFSSTRPVEVEDVASTWHIWKSEKINGKWVDPVFVDIPNLRNKLVSHPTVTNSGTLYFHSSNLDYSEMEIYQSKLVNGKFSNAEKTIIVQSSKTRKCTPYVSPEEDYLIFASIGNELNLMISYNDGDGNWVKTKKFNKDINTEG